ncbi:MAG TPA: hypothetical protein EYG75_04865 [Campylobacterales bacterium]|nr:hypothetical protein [Campylobacterales bacterium]
MQRKLSPFNPDKTHIHHKMLTWRGSVDHSVFILVTIQVFFSFIGVLFREFGDEISFFLVLIMLYLFFSLLDERKLVRDKLRITKIKKKMAVIIKEDITHKKAVMILGAVIVFLLALRVAL